MIECLFLSFNLFQIPSVWDINGCFLLWFVHMRNVEEKTACLKLQYITVGHENHKLSQTDVDDFYQTYL